MEAAAADPGSTYTDDYTKISTFSKSQNNLYFCKTEPHANGPLLGLLVIPKEIHTAEDRQ